MKPDIREVFKDTEVNHYFKQFFYLKCNFFFSNHRLQVLEQDQEVLLLILLTQ